MTEHLIITQAVRDYFLKINNRDAFLLGDIPKYHPQSTDHLKFWREEKRKCIEGLWAQDSKEENIEGMWRYMPSNLYFYVNFGSIDHNDPKGSLTSAKKTMRPFLRDVEWEFFYNLLEAKGFTGFKEDDEYSCHRGLIDPRAKEDDQLLKRYCRNSDGSMREQAIECLFSNNTGKRKKYIPARKYLRMLHDKPLGLPVYEQNAQNLFMLGARGFGKSYMVGVGVILHEILFDGAREYNQASIENPAKVSAFVGAAQAGFSSDILSKTESAMENLPGAWGEDTDMYEPSPFFKEMAGTLKPNNKKNKWRHEYEKEVNGSWVKVGSKSSVNHGTFTSDNPEAAVGGRYGVLAVEEVGLMGNLLEAHGANVNCLREGSIKFGVAVYLGTGGNVEKVRETETIFRNPKAYEFIEFDDIWESSGKIGWFVPAYYSLNQFKDENGNTILEDAFEYLKEERERLIGESKSSLALEKEMMNMPTLPSEMFLTRSGNIFPVPEIRQRLRRLAEDDTFYYLQKKIDILWDSKQEYGVRYRINEGGLKTPIDDYPYDGDDKEGCFVMYESPIYDNEGKVPQGLYIFGHDPYAIDGEGESLGSFFVFKTGKYPQYGHEELVAEYIGRPFAGRNAFNEIMEKAIALYGNQSSALYFENVRGNTKEYFDKKKKLGLLCRRPKTVLSKTVKRQSATSVEFGYPMTSKEMKIEAIRMTRDWLLEERQTLDGKIVRNLDLIPSRRLLKEWASFNMDDNFDSVMGFAGCIIGLRERENELLEELTEESAPDPMAFFNGGSKIFKQKQW